eukprot:g34697.t1
MEFTEVEPGRKGQNRRSQTSTEKRVMLPRRRRRRERDGDGGRRRQRRAADEEGYLRLHLLAYVQLVVVIVQIITIIQVALAMHELLTTQDLLALCLFDTRLGNRAGDNLLMYHLREVQGGDCVVIWKISCVSRLERMVLARVLYNLKRLWLLVYMFWAHLATCTVEAQRWGWSYQSMKKHTMRFARAVVRVYGDTLFEFPETVGQLQTACDLMMLEREVLGAMDGKIFFMNFGADDNVALKSYKGGRGVNVLALVSADYRFRWHSAFVGGNDVDASLWNKTSLKQRIARLEWPPEDSRQAINEPQEESLTMRPIILVDCTFAGSPVLQKPYPVAQLDLPSKLLFNKIHDSGRKVVEQAFGQVVGRFGIFAQPVRWLAESTPEDLADVIKCAFILHNLCIDMHDV